jgi:hypothetical protein
MVEEVVVRGRPGEVDDYGDASRQAPHAVGDKNRPVDAS